MKALIWIGAILVLLASVGACNPRLRRAYLEAKYLESKRAGKTLFPVEDSSILSYSSSGQHPVLQQQQRQPPQPQQPPMNLNNQQPRTLKMKDHKISVQRRVLPEEAAAVAGKILVPPNGLRISGLTPEQLAKVVLPLTGGRTNAKEATEGGEDDGVETPEWNLAMINYLLAMKAKGHKINEIHADKQPLAELHKDLTSWDDDTPSDPLVCKTAPYNICYRLDKFGVLHPLGDRRPVRILRVY